MSKITDKVKSVITFDGSKSTAVHSETPTVEQEEYIKQVTAQFEELAKPRHCRVCGEQLHVNNLLQIVFYHAHCRSKRHRK